MNKREQAAELLRQAEVEEAREAGKPIEFMCRLKGATWRGLIGPGHQLDWAEYDYRIDPSWKPEVAVQKTSGDSDVVQLSALRFEGGKLQQLCIVNGNYEREWREVPGQSEPGRKARERWMWEPNLAAAATAAYACQKECEHFRDQRGRAVLFREVV